MPLRSDESPRSEPAALDRVLLSGLVVDAIVGVHEAERQAPQPVEIDLELTVDLARAGRSDSLDDTVDYERVEARVREIVGSTSFFLLEALATRVTDALLADDAVERVRIRMRKARRASGVRTGVELVRP